MAAGAPPEPRGSAAERVGPSRSGPLHYAHPCGCGHSHTSTPTGSSGGVLDAARRGKGTHIWGGHYMGLVFTHRGRGRKEDTYIWDGHSHTGVEKEEGALTYGVFPYIYIYIYI